MNQIQINILHRKLQTWTSGMVVHDWTLSSQGLTLETLLRIEVPMSKPFAPEHLVHLMRMAARE